MLQCQGAIASQMWWFTGEEDGHFAMYNQSRCMDMEGESRLLGLHRGKSRADVNRWEYRGWRTFTDVSVLLWEHESDVAGRSGQHRSQRMIMRRCSRLINVVDPCLRRKAGALSLHAFTYYIPSRLLSSDLTHPPSLSVSLATDTL